MGSGAAIPLPPGPTGFPTDSRGRWRTKEMPQKAGSQANGHETVLTELEDASYTLLPGPWCPPLKPLRPCEEAALRKAPERREALQKKLRNEMARYFAGQAPLSF
ncbi:unnamed protein product [Symbiodinium natans]|uniref:Uncharacterized protein n=1 Tax=Symbiodinium natans TaxID=878477 RepID=A0A812V369_9DINO|nr:unnamed protein product [Symbiodinium natans]